MSMELTASERICYAHCNFCNTVLAVSVPCSSLFNMVTVRCGHCTSLWSLNVEASLFSPRDSQQLSSGGSSTDSGGSSSKSTKVGAFESVHHDQPRLPPVRPPERRQRLPSAYNKFIKDEIQRIKASNPGITHKEAFSTAAKNWAHFPRIHLGMKTAEGNKQAKLDNPFAGEGMNKKAKTSGFF